MISAKFMTDSSRSTALLPAVPRGGEEVSPGRYAFRCRGDHHHDIVPPVRIQMSETLLHVRSLRAYARPVPEHRILQPVRRIGTEGRRRGQDSPSQEGAD